MELVHVEGETGRGATSRGHGDVAINSDFTLLAAVDVEKNCLYIYAVATDELGNTRLHSPRIVLYLTSISDANLCIKRPNCMCFTRTNTLLLPDSFSDIIELSTEGHFLRSIVVPDPVRHVACCCLTDVLAVACDVNGRADGRTSGKVSLLAHATGAVLHTVHFANATGAVGFSACGSRFTVADYYRDVLTTFCASTAQVVSEFSCHAMRCPFGILVCDDGDVVVTCTMPKKDEGGGCHIRPLRGHGMNRTVVFTASNTSFKPRSAYGTVSALACLCGDVLMKSTDGLLHVIPSKWRRRLGWVAACTKERLMTDETFVTCVRL